MSFSPPQTQQTKVFALLFVRLWIPCWTSEIKNSRHELDVALPAGRLNRCAPAQ